MVYVLSKDNRPLMPVKTFAKARRLLKAKKAVVVNTVPFTIKLTYDIEDPVISRCLLGIDPGRTNIGLCVIDETGHVLYASDAETRNKTIAKLMLARKQSRQASRRGERKRRQRRTIASDKTGMAKAVEFWRMLPGCEEPICCKAIRNTEAKFNNRKRPQGWLTPTARQLLQTHGFKDVYEAVSHQQVGKCLLCRKRNIEHYHHLTPRHLGGSDTIDNLAGLCLKCHEKVHTDPKAKVKLLSKAEGQKKKYHALSIINQIMERLLKECVAICPTYITTGYETKCLRELYNLEKDHYVDAWCIAVSALDIEPEKPIFEGTVHAIRQFRRHDRAVIKSQRERTYKLDGKMIAKNRRPRFEQQGPALSDLNLTQGEISRLEAVKSTRYYNTPGRLMPGTVFIYNGKRHVMSGQITNGQYLRAVGDDKTNYPISRCRIIEHNKGLVYVS